MKKTIFGKVTSAVVAILMVASIIPTSVTAADGGQGTDTLEVGVGKSFTTLEAAVDVANQGDTVKTIKIYPGTYDIVNTPGYGILEVKKPISFIGVDQNGNTITDYSKTQATITSSAAKSPDNELGEALICLRNGITSFQGLKFVAADHNNNGALYTYLVDSTFHLFVKNCYFDVNTKTGLGTEDKSQFGARIFLDGDSSTARATIENNYFVKTGVRVWSKEDSEPIVIRNNVFDGKPFYENEVYNAIRISDSVHGTSSTLAKSTFNIEKNAFINQSEKVISMNYQPGGEIEVSNNYWGINPDFSKLLYEQQPCKITNSSYFMDKEMTYKNNEVVSLAINKTESTIEKGSTEELTTTIKAGSDASDITWTSSKPEVATVVNGKVKAVAKGETTIKATAGNKSANCVISVYEKVVNTDPPKIETPKDSPIKVELPKETTSIMNDSINEVLADLINTTAVDDKTKDKIIEALANGETISSRVVANVVKKDKISEEAKKMEKTLKENEVIGAYLNLDVLLTANGKDMGSMSKLSAPITFTISIPEELIKEGRTYFIVTIHNGVTKKIPAVVKDGMLSFSTKEFSTFAIAYEMKKEEMKPIETPDTADTTDLVLWTSVLLSALGFGVLSIKKFKEN
ncbi:MAG: Ig-like domain-containing protein [Erysipelotrichaceae bacterium]